MLARVFRELRALFREISSLFGRATNETLLEHKLSTGQVIQVVQGDITAEDVDAIVNAANEHLLHGLGVAGAIRRKGGRVIRKESKDWVRTHGRVITGSAAITSAGKLPAKYVIHAVGPVWGRGDDEAKLTSAVNSALSLAEKHEATSLSIPGISSGIFGGPKDVCARIIIQATLDHLQQTPSSSLQQIRFCSIDHETATVFLEETKKILEQG
jgi:O-acetyl-ADP-ribose deacetylase (regulator of RNase III)